MGNEDDPRVVIWGLASLAKEEGRLVDLDGPPVRGISKIGANIDRLTQDQWLDMLKGVPLKVRRELALLHLVPEDERPGFADILMHISGPDPGFTEGQWDVTQSFIDYLSADNATLEMIARAVATLDILT